MRVKKPVKYTHLAFLIITSLLICPVFGNEPVANQSFIYEIDTLRANLSLVKDRESQNYLKTKQKLDKTIKQNKFDYTPQSRLLDVERLIGEHKFNSAIYELNELILIGYEKSKCYELLGDIGLKSGKDLRRISKYYKQSLELNPDNVSCCFKLSKLYLRERKNVIGLEYLKQTVEKTNNTVLLNEIEKMALKDVMPQNKFEANNLYEILGHVYVKLNKKEASYSAFKKALEFNPEDIYLKYYLGSLLYKNNQNLGAIAIFDSILKENPSDTQIRISKAKSYLKEGNKNAAYLEYIEILKINPESKQAKYGIYKIYENSLTPDKILEKIYPDNKNLAQSQKEHKNFSRFLQEMKDFEGAAAFTQFAEGLNEIEKQKYSTMPKPQLKERLQTKKEIEDKEFARLKALEDEQIKKEALKQAQIEEEAKQKALLELESAKKRELESAKKLAIQEQEKELKLKQQIQQQETKRNENEKKAIALERQKAIEKNPEKFKEYSAIIDEYLKIKPQTVQSLSAIANTYKLMGTPTSALRYYREAIKLEPANSDLYYSMGLIYLELNDTKSSKTNLIKAVNLNKENTKALNLLTFVNQKLVTEIINKAYSRFEKKEYVSAFEVLNEGIKNYPQHAQLYYYRALASDALNRNAAQIIDLQKAIELSPGYYMAYYQLGIAYEKIGDERSALVAYERFLSIEPEEKDLVAEVEKKVEKLSAKYY